MYKFYDPLAVYRERVRVEADGYRRAALDHVNDVRQRLGRPPMDRLLPGVPGKPGDCTIARSIRYAIPWVQVLVCTLQTTVTLPNGASLVIPWESTSVETFVSNFDKSHYHDLVA